MELLKEIHGVGKHFLLFFDNAISLHASHHQGELHRFDDLIQPALTSRISVCAGLVAIPLISQVAVGKFFVQIMNCNIGRVLLKTETLAWIYSDPFLWGRYLYVLAKKDDQSGVALYGYDLKGEGIA